MVFNDRVKGSIMKNIYLIIGLIVVLSVPLMAQTRVDVKYGLGYTSNIYELSESDQESFDEGKDFQYIETSDDFIQKLGLGIVRTKRTKDFRYTPSLKMVQTLCLNNPDKNTFNVIGGINSRYKDIQTDFRYGYYPKNYVREYMDSDGSKEDEKYTYEKNLYKISVSYEFMKKIIPIFYTKYENYYYNKHFTESDANALTIGFGCKYEGKYGDIQGFYYYRHYMNESDNSIMQAIIDNDKNSSYNSNIFEMKYTMKKVYTTNFDYKPFLGVIYRSDYYQTDLDLQTDPIHSGRVDHKISIDLGTEIFIAKNLNFKLDLVQDIRKVHSDNVNLDDAKDFSKTQVFGNFTWSFDLGI